MNLSLLDNPIWHALNSYHDHLAIRGEGTVRYPPDILGAVAMPENSRVGFINLRGLVETNESVVVLGPRSEDLPGWEVVHMDQAWQLIHEDLKPAPRVDAVVLTAKNVPEMLDLVNLAQPGPFLPRAIELGQFLGLRQDGHLVAMAGQRLHLPGFCEVSTVCTHPDYRGRGYAGSLTTMMAQSILERQETAFLHVAPGNDRALRLYLKLGFRIRTQIQLSILRKLAD
jgi:ribosomal protein S18 acetylase RimI-like enzyme